MLRGGGMEGNTYMTRHSVLKGRLCGWWKADKEEWPHWVFLILCATCISSWHLIAASSDEGLTSASTAAVTAHNEGM